MDKLTVKELKNECCAKNIRVPSGYTKPQIIALLNGNVTPVKRKITDYFSGSKVEAEHFANDEPKRKKSKSKKANLANLIKKQKEQLDIPNTIELKRTRDGLYVYENLIFNEGIVVGQVCVDGKKKNLLSIDNVKKCIGERIPFDKKCIQLITPTEKSCVEIEFDEEEDEEEDEE